MRPEHSFDATLILLMKETGMTVKAAARIAEVGPSTIQSWRSGAKPTNFDAVRRLAQAFGTSLSFLLTGEEDYRPDQGSKREASKT